MSDSSRSALRLALSLADPATADALADRMKPQLLAVLADRLGMPAVLVDELLGGDAGQQRAALEADPVEWLAAAAETGDPVVGQAIWQAEYRDDDGSKVRAVAEAPGLLRILLEAGDFSDPRWYAEDGLLQELYETRGPLMVAVLTSGFVGLSVEGLAALGAYLPPPVVIDACLTLLTLWGTTAPFVEWLRMHDEVPLLSAWQPQLPDLLRAAVDAPDPEAYLRRHRPAGEWTDPEHLHALARVRCGHPVARPDGLDWALIRKEHERLPFRRENLPTTDPRASTPLLLLTQWEGCPDVLLWESFREDPTGTAEYAAELPFEAFTVLWTDREERDGVLLRGLGRGIRAGRLPVERVLAEVGPAETVLTHLPLDHGPTRKALTDLLDALGTDPVNWLTFYARMNTARGSVVELVADATAPHTRGRRHTSWPRPVPAQFPAESPEHTRSTFLEVFACASEEARTAVVPFFDARAVQHLLAFGNPSPEVRAAVVAAHGPSAQVAMAGGCALSDAELRYLLDLDEPAVDAALFRHGRLDRAACERLLAGRLRAGGSRPVPGELLAALDDPDATYDRTTLTAGLGSGDLGVARSLLRRLRWLHLPASRLRLLVAVWERSGPDAVREILAMDHLPDTLRRRTEQLLTTPDGLESLRRQLAEAESPAALMAYLTAPAGRPHERLRRLRSEGLTPPWEALTAAHDAGTLPRDLLSALWELRDCPRPLLLAGLKTLPVWGADWIRAALNGGRLTHADILTHATPARAALHNLQQYAGDRPGDEPDAIGPPLRIRAAALTQEHLGTNVDAWALCLQLLPTFAGSLPELLAKANTLKRRPI
ncbi:hypothetical protein [Streptomyces noursei]|uniref:hypothetical protein n=1 Tax=Streptomyces noursei TaxID=1971 RepID=UPI001965F04F|nr:hypothetical protein [Streptomyces noursei]QRX89822.1 hypothetical protein JNO44_02180 [Streptomyces noursei]